MRYLYSALFMLLLPLLVLRMVWRSRRAPAYRQRLLERLGLFTAPTDDRPTLWIHAVSLGETLAARPLIERLLKERPDYHLVVTTTTPTGSAQVQRLFGKEVFHVYAPWDTPGAVTRFFRRTRPRLLILIETELWPNMLHYAQAYGCRAVLANARLSARSAAGYARFPRSTRAMFGALDWVGAQASADADRFLQLGMEASRIHVSGSIKFDIRVDNTTREEAGRLRASWGTSRPTVIVASTHSGEDAIALEAFDRLREWQGNVLLLLAPRHPERFEEVYEALCSRGLAVQRRSVGGTVDGATQVLLVDTLGELFSLFGTADVAVIGGSFVPNGGHNPLEAAAWGLPAVSGPSMFNFADITQQLLEVGGLEQVNDAASLGDCLRSLLDDGEEARRRGQAALGVLEENRGALERLYAGIDGLL